MKKMTTLFVVEYHAKGTPGVISREVRPENDWVYTEPGVRATHKFDGTACAVIDGKLYVRYDAKAGKQAPVGSLPCQEPDPISGHHPHWAPADRSNPSHKWAFEAFDVTRFSDGTYELCGPKIGGNKENLGTHVLLPHGESECCLLKDFSFDSIKDYLSYVHCEGIVFHGADGKMCKIRKTDFGFKW